MSEVIDNGTTSHFDVSQLPSITQGMSSVEEAMKRRKTCRFIEEAGRVLKLPRVAISTAMVFFHRFYAKHAFQEHDRFEVAVAALVLAAKTEEAPKKLNTVIQECYKLKARAMQAGRLSQQRSSSTAAAGGSDTPPPPLPSSDMKASSSSAVYLDTKGEDFLKLKERILLLERIILHTIGFELSIDHPYKFFVDMIKKLISTRQLKYSSSKVSSSSSSSSLDNTKTSEVMSKMMNELVQYSMSTANDSYQTSLCLQFGPKEIATACVYLACMFSGVEPINGDWKKTLLAGGANNSYIDVESLVSVCIQIIDLIADKKASDTESVRKIRKALELLKSREEQAQQAAAASSAGASAGGGGGERRSPRPPPPPSGGSGGEPSSNKRPRVG